MLFKLFRLAFSLSALLLCINIAALWLTNSLTLYIHPRYEVFTVSIIAFGAVLLLLHLITSSDIKQKTSLSKLATVLFCLLALAIPTQTLSSRAALNREQSGYNTEKISTSSYDEFSKDYSTLTISEWSSLLSTSPQAEQIVGKTAVIEGFALVDNDTAYLARFRIACCSVDATPLTIPLTTDTSKSLVTDNWYRATGEFIFYNNEFQLQAEVIEQIEEPDEPYIF